MNPYIYSLLLSLLFLGGTLYFVKKRVLDFKHSMFWLILSVILIILSVNKNLTEKIADFVKIDYAPSFLFVTGIVGIFFLIFYLTIVISSMQNKIATLTQEIGLLTSKLEKEETEE